MASFLTALIFFFLIVSNKYLSLTQGHFMGVEEGEGDEFLIERDAENSNDTPDTAEEVQLAQILTKASQPNLERLDAGDLVECYLLTRHAKLKLPLTPASSSYDSETTNTTAMTYVSVSKTALGFRYKPRPGDTREEKPKFELTLEYGPQRTGATMDSEAMPLISRSTEGDFISWENEGKVYFETSISSEWDTATYLCPITGAVLSKILDLAVEYTTTHPRYQPFEVIDTQTTKPILRSSSGDDFVWTMFDGMAQLYVDITPILIPPKRKIRLFVNGTGDIQKLNAVEVKDRVVNFYTRFYECVRAMTTGDFSYFETVAPTLAPTVAVTGGDEDNDGNNNNTRRVDRSLDDDDKNSTLKNPETTTVSQEQQSSPLESSDAPTASIPLIAEDIVPDADTEEANDLITGTIVQDSDIASLINNTSSAVASSGTAPPQPDQGSEDTGTTSAIPTAEPSISMTPTLSPSSSMAPTLPPTDASQTASAQAAAAATEAAAASAFQSLTSGDGDLITSTLSPCLMDPFYQNHGTVYLFLDGTAYFQLQLTAPYWEAVALHNEPLPTPSIQPTGKGDFVDWFLVLTMVGMLLLGLMLALTKMGFCPYFLFNKGATYSHQTETVSSFEEYGEEDQEEEGRLGEESIPPSMGGVELSPRHRRNPPPPTAFAAKQNTKRNDTNTNGNGNILQLESPPQTITKWMSKDGIHPEDVALPNLSFTSRVAMPVAHSASNEEEEEKGIV